MNGLPEVKLIRDIDNDLSGPTFGKLIAPNGFELHTMERPALGDHPRVKPGSYRVKAFDHPDHGFCYQLEDRDGRTAILIHSANWIRQLLGCIALGRAVMVVEGDWKHNGVMEHVREIGVSSSGDAVKAFMAHMGGMDFMLTIY